MSDTKELACDVKQPGAGRVALSSAGLFFVFVTKTINRKTKIS